MINSKRLASNSNLGTQTYFRLPRRGSTGGGGDSAYMRGVGTLVGNFELNP